MRSSRVLLALAAACMADCSAIPGESLGSAPVFHLKGHVDVSKLRTSGKPLYVTLAWGSPQQYDSFCLEKGNAVPGLADACGSPFSFAARQRSEGQALRLDEGGNFEWTVKALPEARLTVGTAAGRVAYGSFLVYEAQAGDEAFNPNGWIEGDGKFEPLSRVLAASFSSLLRPQHRVVLREGAWGVAPLYYPLFGCTTEPAQGFSLVRATMTVTTEGAFSGSCDFQPPTDAVELLPLSEKDAKEIECSQRMVQSTSPEVFGDVPPPASAVCLDTETLVHVDTVSQYCPSAMVVRLKGCWDPGDSCEEPDWDFTSNRPSWWPCVIGVSLP